MTRAVVLLGLVGCTSSRRAIDFEATCGAFWPPDECASGRCGDGEVERAWVGAFEPAFAAESRLEGDPGRYGRVRSIKGSPNFSAVTEASWQFQADWLTVVVPDVSLWVDTVPAGTGPGERPPDSDLVARWRQWMNAPAFDLRTDLMSWSDAQAVVDDCGAELGVTFDAEGWCEPWYATQWDEDDGALWVQFYADVGANELARVAVDLTEEQPSLCDVTARYVD